MITGAAFFVAAIIEKLAVKLLLKQFHGPAMHCLSFRAIKMQATKGESREIFKPMVSAMAMLWVSLKPAQLLPE